MQEFRFLCNTLLSKTNLPTYEVHYQVWWIKLSTVVNTKTTTALSQIGDVVRSTNL